MRPTRTLADHLQTVLLGLASGGVYLGRRVTATPVRSYRTISPLPAWSSAAAPGLGGVVSVALSRGFRRVGVTDHPYPVMSGLSSKASHLRDCSASKAKDSRGTHPPCNRRPAGR